MAVRYAADMVFNSQRLGAVVSLSPSAEPYRLHGLHLGPPSTSESEALFLASVCRTLGISGGIQLESVRLKALARLSSSIADILSRMAIAGLFRHSGGLDNFTFDMEAGTPAFIDLDSTLEMETVPFSLRPLYAVRDLISFIQKLLNKFYHPSVLPLYSPAEIVASDCVCAALQRYFPSADSHAIARASSAIWGMYWPMYFTCRAVADADLITFHRIRRALKMDFGVFYAVALFVCSQLYPHSRVSERYKPMYSLDRLQLSISRYLGPDRYAYFTTLTSSLI
jgi:hypothetical protein